MGRIRRNRWDRTWPLYVCEEVSEEEPNKEEEFFSEKEADA
jgi:hypothetical protein